MKFRKFENCIFDIKDNVKCIVNIKKRLEGVIVLFVIFISFIEDGFVLWKILIFFDRICKLNIFKMVIFDEVLLLYVMKCVFNYNLYLNICFLYVID